jgi:hypothetical protein
MSTVDLYQMRCAVATLVCAARCGGQLDLGGVRRVDAAVAVLSAARDANSSGRGVGDAIDRLLNKARDPGGTRTIAAIDELAQLTHVEDDTAPALASRLRPAPTGQRQLFDPDDPR